MTLTDDSDIATSGWTQVDTNSIDTPFTQTELSAGASYGIQVGAFIPSNNGDWSGTIQRPWGADENGYELSVPTPS